ncbi:MAG: hypothetical protein F9K32_19385 [Desulfobulbaceae bacterium]|nr:MAG: hypothetical protein F9K32_19385 [Desulfobulbaceae bacterium]
MIQEAFPMLSRFLFALPACLLAGAALAQPAPGADYSVTITDAPDPVTTGATLTYAYTVENLGPFTGGDTAVELALPPSVGFVSLVAPSGAPIAFTCTTPAVGASGVVRCTTTSFWLFSPRTFTVEVKVLATSGTITSTATVIPINPVFPDTNLANNTAVAITAIRPSAPVARAVPALSVGALAGMAASCALLGAILLRRRPGAGSSSGF